MVAGIGGQPVAACEYMDSGYNGRQLYGEHGGQRRAGIGRHDSRRAINGGAILVAAADVMAIEL